MKLSSILKNKSVKNAGWLIGGRIAQMIVSFFVGLLTTRYLGPSNYGLINYAAAYSAFFISICDLGINGILVKEFIDNPHMEGEIIGTALGLKAISSILSAALILIISFFVDAGDTLTIAVVFLETISMMLRIFETFNYWFQSRLQSKITAQATFIAYILTAIYKIYLMATEKGVLYFAFTSCISNLCFGAILFAEYKRNCGSKLSFSSKYGKHLLQKSYHFILPGIMVAIYGQTDKLMLKQMISQTEIGYYATATAICSMWCFVLSAIIDSVYPSIMEAHKSDYLLFEKRNRQLYAIIFYLSAFVAIVLFVFAKPVIYILYGKAYLAAANPLRIITWYTAFSYFGVARSAWLVCEDKQNYLLPVYMSAAVSNVILNLLLIPRWGASGAALASLTAQIVTTLITPFFIKPLRRNSILMIEAICLKDVFESRKA